MEFDFPKLIGALGNEERISFYELLANNLTISVRGIWSYDHLTGSRESSASTTYPPATAGGTDPIQARRLTFEAKPHMLLTDSKWSTFSRWLSAAV